MAEKESNSCHEDGRRNLQGKLALINNAGIFIAKPATEFTEEGYFILVKTNFEASASHHLSQLAHPILKASGSGCILFISSVAGLVAVLTSSIYSATKGNPRSSINMLFFLAEEVSS
ncbi:Tropinone reductase -like protein [Capsicum chinense]|nr:Tropinone reductase -like protein [Capsicum chinense]